MDSSAFDLLAVGGAGSVRRGAPHGNSLRSSEEDPFKAARRAASQGDALALYAGCRTRVSARFPGLSAKKVVTMLLSDLSLAREWMQDAPGTWRAELSSAVCSSPNAAAGRILACYLIKVEDDDFPPGGVEAWIAEVRAGKYREYHEQHSILSHALAYVPVVRHAMSQPAAPRAAAGGLDLLVVGGGAADQRGGAAAAAAADDGAAAAERARAAAAEAAADRERRHARAQECGARADELRKRSVRLAEARDAADSDDDDEEAARLALLAGRAHQEWLAAERAANAAWDAVSPGRPSAAAAASSPSSAHGSAAHAAAARPAVARPAAPSGASQTMLDGLSDVWEPGLPLRTELVCHNAQSRNEVRAMATQSLIEQGAFMAKAQADAEARKHEGVFVPTPEGRRGVMRPASHLQAAAAFVTAKVTTGLTREAEDPVTRERPGGVVEQVGLDDDEEAGRARTVGNPLQDDGGRRYSDADVKELGLFGGEQKGSWQYALPKEGTELVGWRCMRVFDSGVDNKLGWHGEDDRSPAFVLSATRDGSGWRYKIYFEEDKKADPLKGPYPNLEVAFRKPSSKKTKVVSAEQLAAARAIVAKAR